MWWRDGLLVVAVAHVADGVARAAGAAVGVGEAGALAEGVHALLAGAALGVVVALRHPARRRLARAGDARVLGVAAVGAAGAVHMAQAVDAGGAGRALAVVDAAVDRPG